MDPIVIVLGLLVVAVALFATRALPVELVPIFLLLALVLTGILDTAQAFAGFSSQIIIILGSIFIINGALLRGACWMWFPLGCCAWRRGARTSCS